MIEDEEPFRDPSVRRRRRLLFRERKVPVRLLVPNFFTLLSLCAGVTAIRMAIEGRYELAIGLIVAAAMLDGVDGRLARALKAQSRFGAELDSLADFINFGVAPAIVLFTWGLGGLKGFGWLAVLLFACGMGLRLARFNSMLEVDKPKWQSNYFTGMPAPAGAITVLLPFYIDGLGIVAVKQFPLFTALYTLAMAFLLVSTIPTFSGKLMGERIRGELLLPIMTAVAALVGSARDLSLRHIDGRHARLSRDDSDQLSPLPFPSARVGSAASDRGGEGNRSWRGRQCDVRHDVAAGRCQ